MATFTSPFGTYDLQRFPPDHHPSLRAWDAADEYLLQHFKELQRSGGDKPRLLIVEDGFGALTLALQAYQPTVISDSFLAHEAIRRNAAAHATPAGSFTLCSPLQRLEGAYDVVLLKTPKSQAYLEDLLLRIKPHLHPKTVVVGAGMTRHVRTATLEAYERIIGPTTTSLARKKARLIFAEVDPVRGQAEEPVVQTYALENTPYTISNYASVFSRDELDNGTRLLLRYMPAHSDAGVIVDLGCGSGVIGLMAAAQHLSADVHFVDASFMAIASAETTLVDNLGEAATERCRFIVSDGLAHYPNASADLILCNPPFHQQHANGQHLAFRMFDQAHAALRSGGALWIVANRHLGYRARLQRQFQSVLQVAATTKFVVWEALKG